MVAYGNMTRAELIETIGSLESRLASAAFGASSAPGSAARFPEFGEQERREFEKSPSPIRIFDRETLKYLAVTDAALELYGYTREEFLELTLLDTRHPDEGSEFFATLLEPSGYLRHRKARRHLKKSGEMIMVEIVAQDILFDGRAARLNLTLDVTERVRMETLLRKREQEFSALVENAPDIITRFDRELRHVYVNPAVAAASGIARRAFMGKTHRELGMPEHLVALWEQEIRRVFDSGKGQRTEFECPCRGELRYFEARVVPESGPDGATETVLAIARDITERNLASEIQANLAAIVESSPDAIVSRNLDGTFLSWNTAAERLFGYSAGEMVGKNVRPIVPEDLVEESQRLRESVNAGNTHSQFETVRVNRDGRRIHVSVSAAPIRDAAGHVARVAIIFHDITARKQAERALRVSEEFLRRVIESSSDCIKVFDLEGRLQSMSRGGQQLLEIDDINPLLGTFWLEFWHGANRETAARALAAGRKGDSASFEGYCPTLTGEPKWWDVIISPIMGPDGGPERLLAVSRDITARKQAEDELRRQKNLLDGIIDNLPVGVFIRDALTSRYLLRNRFARECFGYAAAGSAGETVHELYPKELAERMLDSDRRALETRQMVEIPEQPVLGRSGDTRIQHVRKVPLFDKNGQPWVIVGIADDITERKRAELAMQRSAALARLLESLARAANEALTPEAAMAACLERICLHGNWTLGRVALFERGKPEYAPPRSMWHAPERERFAELIRVTHGRNHRGGGGFINRVLREQAAVWIEDLQQVARVGRMVIAAKQGLRAGFAFPIVVTGQVVALIEVLSTEPRPQDPLLMAAAQTIASQLARIVERAWAQESNARMAAIVESSQDAILSRTLDGTILTWNSAAERLFGYSAAEALGRHFSLIVPAELRQGMASRQVLLQQGGRIPAFETARITKDGRRIDVSISASPIREDNGAARAISVIIRDITERKRAEDELKRQKKLLDAIIEHLPVGVTVKDARTLRYTLRNRMAAELTGWSNAEAIGKTADEFYPPELAELIAATDRKALSTGAVVSGPTRVVQQITGRIGRNLKVPVPDDTGRYTHLVNILEDLTDIEQAQAALRRSEQRLRQLISMSPAAIFSFSLDPPLVTTFISENVTAQVGWQPSDFTSNPAFWLEHVHPEDRAHAEEAVSKIAVDGKYVCEYRFRHKDGSWRWMRDEGQMVRDADNRPREAIGTWMDITAERLESEERVQRMLHQRDALVREVHHRIKNNLQGVVGLLRQLAGERREIRPLMDKAVAQLQAVAIVHGLQGRSLREGISLGDMVPAIAKAIEERIHVPLHVEITADADTLMSLSESEGVPIALALNEVMVNAAKYASAHCERDEVRVTLSGGADWARVTISNPGSLPLGFDFPGGKGVGTGLELVKSLLPQKGVSLAFSQVGDRVETALEMFGPAVTQRATLPAQLEAGRRASFPA